MITKEHFDRDLDALLAEDENPFNAWVSTPTGVQSRHPLEASVLILGINNTEGLKHPFRYYWDPESGYNQPLRDLDLGELTPSKGRMRSLVPEEVGVVKTNVYEKNSAKVKDLTAAAKVVREKTIIWILGRCLGIKVVVTLGVHPAKVYTKLRERYPGFPPAINVRHPTAWGIRKEDWNAEEAKIAKLFTVEHYELHTDVSGYDD
jgi:hypothetical protein